MTSGTGMRAIRRALVVAEFALAIVLLAGAGLLLRSLRTVEALDPGFRTDRVLMLAIASPRYAAAAQSVDFYARVLEQVRAIPGVQSAGLVSDLFIGGSPERNITTESNAGTATERMRFRADEMSDGLLETIGATLRAGRHFTTADGPDSPRVAIVNEAMAQRLWPSLDPVGRRFKFGPPQSPAPWISVVGVVADMRRQGLEQTPSPQILVPLTQNQSRLLNLLVRTSSPDPLVIVQSVRTAIWGVEKNASIYGISTLDARLAASLLPRRFQTSLLLAFASIALLLAAVGIYGLIRYSIALRNHEIAIRMAVGAQAGEIFRMILGEGLQLTLIGLAIGLVGAFSIGQAGSSLLFGISAADPLTFISVSVLLTAVALAACYFPARRAMSIEPSVALRQD